MTTPYKDQKTNHDTARLTSTKKSRLPVPLKSCESLKKGTKRHLSPSVVDHEPKRSVSSRTVTKVEMRGALSGKRGGRQPGVTDAGRPVLSELPREPRKIHKARRALQITTKPERLTKPKQGKAGSTGMKTNCENRPPLQQDQDFGFEKDDSALQSILNETGIQTAAGAVSKSSMGIGRASSILKNIGTPGRVRHTMDPSKTTAHPILPQRESIGVRTFRKLCDDFMTRQTQAKRLCGETKSTPAEAGFKFDPKLTPSKVTFTSQASVPTFTAGSKDMLPAPTRVDMTQQQSQAPSRNTASCVAAGRASLPATSHVQNPFSAGPRLSLYSQTPSRVKKAETQTLNPVKEGRTSTVPQLPARVPLEVPCTLIGENVKSETSFPFQTPGRAARPSSIYVSRSKPTTIDRRLSLANQTPGRVPRKDPPGMEAPVNMFEPRLNLAGQMSRAARQDVGSPLVSIQSTHVSSPMVHTPRRQPVVHDSSAARVTPQRVTKSATRILSVTPRRVPISSTAKTNLPDDRSNSPASNTTTLENSTSVNPIHDIVESTEDTNPDMDEEMAVVKLLNEPSNLGQRIEILSDAAIEMSQEIQKDEDMDEAILHKPCTMKSTQQELIEQTSSPVLKVKGQGHFTPRGRGQRHLSPRGRVQTMDMRMMSSPDTWGRPFDLGSPGTPVGGQRSQMTPQGQGYSVSEKSQGQGTPQTQSRDLRLMWRTKKTPNKTPVKKEILSPVTIEGILKSPQDPTSAGIADPMVKRKKNITWADTLECYKHTDTADKQSNAESTKDESFDTISQTLQFSAIDECEAPEGAVRDGTCLGDVIRSGKQGQCAESSTRVTCEVQKWPLLQPSNSASHDAMQDEPLRETSTTSSSPRTTTQNAPGSTGNPILSIGSISSCSDTSSSVCSLPFQSTSSSEMGLKVGTGISGIGGGGMPEKVMMAPYSVTNFPGMTSVTQNMSVSQTMSGSLLETTASQSVHQSTGNKNVLLQPSSPCDNHMTQGVMGQGQGLEQSQGNMNIEKDRGYIGLKDVNLNLNNNSQTGVMLHPDDGMKEFQGFSDMNMPNLGFHDNRDVLCEVKKFRATESRTHSQGSFSYQSTGVDVNSNFLSASVAQNKAGPLDGKNTIAGFAEESTHETSLRNNVNDITVSGDRHSNRSDVTLSKIIHQSEQSLSKSVHEVKTPPSKKRTSAFRSVGKSGLTPKVGCLSLKANLDGHKKAGKGSRLNIALKLAMNDNYLEALLDSEVSRLTQAFTIDKIGCSIDRCLNPVAKLMLEADDMHFIPIETSAENGSPHYIDLDSRGSAFSRYMHRAT